MQVAGLNIHPLKSGRAIPVSAADVAPDGFAGDRRFMLVEPDGRFVTQRELQALARVEAVAVEGGVDLRMDGKALAVRFDDPDRRQDVRVWVSDVNAALASETVNETLSQWFGRPVRLVHMDETAVRKVGGQWVETPVPVGFADGFPVLVTTTGSLADLNATLVEKGMEPVGMDRFRTNILVECDEPWIEDTWASIEAGGIVFDLVKPCARCIMTTQDQMTGERIGGNPIQALAVKRMSADRRAAGVLFGWNAVPRASGRLVLGDAVRVLKRRPEGWPMKARG